MPSAPGDRKIRVLALVWAMRAGGSQRYVEHLLERLDRAAFEPCLAVITDAGMEHPVPADVPLNTVLQEPRIEPGIEFGIDPDVLADPASGALWAQQVVERIAHLVDRIRPDVVVCTPEYAAVLAASASRRFPDSTRLVCRIGAEPSFAFSRDGGRLFYRLLAERYLPQSDWIIANSTQIADDLVSNFGVRSDRIMRVSNPLDVSTVRRMSEEDVTEVDFAAGVPRVVFVGRLERIKGVEHLLEAIADLRRESPVECVLIGEGSQRGYLLALTKHLGIDQHVRFLGTHRNPFKFMRRADVFVLPSLSEGMSNVLLEALACGCPIVATDIAGGGTREVLRDGECGLIVPPGDAVALAGAIRGLLADEDARRQFASRARERADDFDTSKVIAESERALLEIAGSPVVGERVAPDPVQTSVLDAAEVEAARPPLHGPAPARHPRLNLARQVLREQGLGALASHALRSLRRRVGLRDAQVAAALSGESAEPAPVVTPVDHPWYLDDATLCVTRPDALSSLQVVLEALALARAREPVRLIVGGPLGSDSSAADLAARAGIGDAVYFATEPSNELREYLHDGAVLIHAPAASDRALPGSLVDAALSGCPIIATKSSTFTIDFLGESERGLLVPMGDTRALAEAVLQIVWDAAACTERVERARAYVGVVQ